MNIIESHIVSENQLPVRLLDFCISNFKYINTRAGIKKAIKKNIIKLDEEDARGGEWLKSGQKIDVYESENSSHKEFPLKLEIIFEDDDIAIINKPAGFEVSGNKYKTIQNALAFNLKTSSRKDFLSRPVPVHRLDYPTSGLLVCAKTHQSVVNLSKQFQEKTIKKTYLAIVNGKLEDSGIIDEELDGKKSITLYESLKIIPSIKSNYVSLIKLKPETGRTHQIRRHLSHIGHPIVGDANYNLDLPLLKGKGLFLSATEIAFIHPNTNNNVEFKLNIPHKFSSLMERELRRFKKFEKR